MLKRYKIYDADCDNFYLAEDGGELTLIHPEDEFVRYEDAAALELRIRELEQQLMTEAEKRAAFEADC